MMVSFGNINIILRYEYAFLKLADLSQQYLSYSTPQFTIYHFTTPLLLRKHLHVQFYVTASKRFVRKKHNACWLSIAVSIGSIYLVYTYSIIIHPQLMFLFLVPICLDLLYKRVCCISLLWDKFAVVLLPMLRGLISYKSNRKIPCKAYKLINFSKRVQLS